MPIPTGLALTTSSSLLLASVYCTYRFSLGGDVDWKFLRGETIMKLHHVVFDNFCDPLFNSINDRNAESDIFLYCFDNSKFPHLDKPLMSYFDAWKFSPDFIDLVIQVCGPVATTDPGSGSNPVKPTKVRNLLTQELCDYEITWQSCFQACPCPNLGKASMLLLRQIRIWTNV